MAHRLYHTLVVSSLLMLNGTLGCSRSHRSSEADAGRPQDAGELEPDAAYESDVVDGGSESDVGVSRDGGDPRVCELGWPTTKGWRYEEILVEEEHWVCPIDVVERLPTDAPPNLDGCCPSDTVEDEEIWERISLEEERQ